MATVVHFVQSVKIRVNRQITCNIFYIFLCCDNTLRRNDAIMQSIQSESVTISNANKSNENGRSGIKYTTICTYFGIILFQYRIARVFMFPAQAVTFSVKSDNHQTKMPMK